MIGSFLLNAPTSSPQEPDRRGTDVTATQTTATTTTIRSRAAEAAAVDGLLTTSTTAAPLAATMSSGGGDNRHQPQPQQQQQNQKQKQHQVQQQHQVQADSVGSLLAAVADRTAEGLRILGFSDKRQWGPDEHEQVRALEELLDEARKDFQELSPLLNGQFNYEHDRTRESWSCVPWK